MAQVTPITIRTTDRKFLADLIEWLMDYPMNVDKLTTLVTLQAEEDFDFETDSGLDKS